MLRRCVGRGLGAGLCCARLGSGPLRALRVRFVPRQVLGHPATLLFPCPAPVLENPAPTTNPLHLTKSFPLGKDNVSLSVSRTCRYPLAFHVLF